MDMAVAADDFVVYLRVEKNYTKNTIDSYTYDLNTYRNFLKKNDRSLELESLNRSTSRRFIQDLSLNQGLKPRTINRRIASLRAFTKFCMREDFIDIDFMGGIESNKLEDRLPIYMNLAELLQFFRFLETDTRRFALRNHLMFKLLATTGLRRQELVDLTWERIDFDAGTIRPFGKGRKERLLPLHPIVFPLFERYRAQLPEWRLHRDEYIFLNYRGKPLGPRGLHKIFKDTIADAGLPPKKFTLHHLRHTFATLMLQTNKENVDLRTLQILLGHANIQSTTIYTHVDIEGLKKAVYSFLRKDERPKTFENVEGIQNEIALLVAKLFKEKNWPMENFLRISEEDKKDSEKMFDLEQYIY